LRIVSWNVNGLRSILDKGFRPWLARSRAAIVAVQEVRAHEAQLGVHARAFKGWHRHIVAAARPGYSGVGLFARAAPDEVVSSLGDPVFDDEGRFQLARFGRLTVVNAYFPNGSGKGRDNGRIPYKLAFYRRVFALLEPALREGAPVLVMGDFNTAHREIDLARPRQNMKTSGFTREERAELDRWMGAGWVDTFRHYQPGSGHYSWWSQRFGVREKNVGWRIDYVLASPAAMRYVRRAFIHDHVMGSDHCPIGVDVDDTIVGARGSDHREGSASEPPAEREG
jgi:exodeoxyribonuclease-3